MKHSIKTKLSLEQIVDANPYATISAGIAFVLIVAALMSRQLAAYTTLGGRILIVITLTVVLVISIIRLVQTARYLQVNHLRKSVEQIETVLRPSIGFRYLISILVAVGVIIVLYLTFGGGL